MEYEQNQVLLVEFFNIFPQNMCDCTSFESMITSFALICHKFDVY